MKKPLFKKIAIIGVGLIGGSLGMAIKKRKLAGLVVGVARKDRTLKEAFRKKAIDVGLLDAKEAVRGADLVILSKPISGIIDQLKKISKNLDQKTIVIDVGSSKEQIVKTARRYLKTGSFVGCHPMAGSEKTGVKHAEADLFEKSVCFVTERSLRVEKFWRALGARTIFMDAKSHDRWVAQASHLPHIISFALFQDFPNRKPSVLNPSIQDLARLSQSNAELWSDIILSNDKCILSVLSNLSFRLAKWQQAIRSKNRSQMIQFIKEANGRSSYARS